MLAALTELGLAAGGKDLSLIDPVFTIDTTFETQMPVNPSNIIPVEFGDLGKMKDAETVQGFFQFRSDTADAL